MPARAPLAADLLGAHGPGMAPSPEILPYDRPPGGTGPAVPPAAVGAPGGNVLAGIGWMLVTGLLFVAVTVVVRALGTAIPAPEAAFLRYATGMVFFLPMIGTLRRAPLDRRRWRLFALRGLMHAGGVSLWFYAMARMPVAEVTAMNYLSPVYITLGAALVLGERLTRVRLLAVSCGLLGVLLILRPGFREVTSGHVAMLVAAVFFAASYLTAKRLSGEVSAGVVVAMLSLFVTLALAPLAAAVWVTPGWREVGALFGVAALATTGHWTMTKAFAAAPVSVTQPVTFLQILWAALVGAALFGEPIDPWVALGGGIIVAAASLVAWREGAAARRRAGRTGDRPEVDRSSTEAGTGASS